MSTHYSTKRGLSKRVNRVYTIALSDGRKTQVFTWSRAQAKRIADDVYNKPVKGRGKP